MIRSISALAAATCVAGNAAAVDVTGGLTSVALDFDTLAAAASLELSSVSGDVVAPGELPDSVAFGINSRTAAAPLLQTTFSYDPADFLGTFGGTIEHAGSVFFNSDTVQVGNFTIGFDGTRALGDASGFFVASTVGISAILFDVGAPSTLVATNSSLLIGADLLVSAEFAAFLQNGGLASTDLTGAVVGSALVNAVPAPGAVAIGGIALLGTTRRRR